MGKIGNEMFRLEHADPIHKKIIVVSWIMGNSCNYACHYCAKELHNGSDKWPSFESVKKFVDKICYHYNCNNSDKTLYFDLSGGEITLNNELLNIIDYIKFKKCWVGLITNGSRDLDYWEKIKSKIDHICLTFHPLSTSKEHLLSVVELLHNEVSTHVNIMMEPNSFALCKSFGNDLCAQIKNITMSFQPLVKKLGYDNTMFDYSSSQIAEIVSLEKQIHIEWARKIKTYRGKMIGFYDDGSEIEISTPELLATKSNWVGWNCWAGIEQVVIIPNGDIYRAWCNQDLIGNINNEKIEFPLKPTVCKTSNCFCQLDLALTKRRCGYVDENTNDIVNKEAISIKKQRWKAISDCEIGGKSIAVINEVSDSGLKGQLNVIESQIDYYFAMILFPITFGRELIAKGLSLKMTLDKGKILTIQFPLETNVDYDYYQIQIIGEGEKEYEIYFSDIHQQGYGNVTEWNESYLKEMRLVNEYLNNNINIKINELNVLY